MPSRHRSPLLGWHPPAELSAWARDEAERRGVRLSALLTEALERYRVFLESSREDQDLARRCVHVTHDRLA